MHDARDTGEGHPDPADLAARGGKSVGQQAAVPLAYALSADAVVAALGSDATHGLDDREAQARLAHCGPNELATERATPAWRRFLAQFQDTLVALLLVATAVSIGLWVYERDQPLPYEGLVILAIVLFNGLLGYAQEARAERAITALRAMAAARALVIRGGERRRIPATEIVPGDLILIEEGDTIPADARLLAVTALQVAEAALTGEGLPVTKEAAPLAREAPLGDRVSMVFSGTAVTYGRGLAIVTATGMGTEMGRIAGLLARADREVTPLQRELDRTGRILGAAVLLIAVAIVAVVVLIEGIHSLAGFVEVLLLGVALAVAAVPEGLSAVVTATLAIGMRRMARRNAIVRKLPAVETLGAATVIASDKTGTLTRNEMTVRVIATASGRVELTGTGYAPEGELLAGERPLGAGPLRAEIQHLLRAADLANNASVREQDGRWTVLGDPTEGALIVAARKAGLALDTVEARFPRVGEIPFSSGRKLMSAIARDTERDRLVVFTKGAPDLLLTRSTHELVGDEARPLSPERRDAWHAMNAELAGAALRTLGVAFRTLPPDMSPDAFDDRIERDLVFLGLVGMIDPPRSGAREAVAVADRAGIRSLLITGDHPRAAAAIAAELGISADGRALTGADLDRLDDAQLDRIVRDVAVFARVAPEHKLRIVGALKRGGAVVGMTGDGVNDAPALKAADIGVAMGLAGTDVSKEAADIILTDDNFATIIAAIEEGRAIFSNIRKFLRYLLSSNIGEVLTMFLGVLLAGVIGLRIAGDGTLVLPLLATQILWINLVTDGAPALALGVDPLAPYLMTRPPRAANEGAITGRMWCGIVAVGLIMAAVTLLVLDAGLPGGLIPGDGDLPRARTLAFTTLVFCQLFNVLNARSDEHSAFAGLFRNRWLWGALTLSIALQVMAIYAPFLQRAFDTVALDTNDWLLCIGAASTVLWLRELAKWVGRVVRERDRR